ncbi:MAG: glutamate racemase [Clostridia bacterium]|nr:glutamate racemase [Clostridia bacterium]
MNADGAIGVFDSGLGGLTVLREIRALLPDEKIVYFGDSGRTPYGSKSPDTVLKYTLQDVNFLLSMNVKAVVIACNTASACGTATVREKYSLPVIEVVEPGAEAAVKTTRTGRIGVIGTAATINSKVYEFAIAKAAKKAGRDDVLYFGKACPMFAPLVEEGWWDNKVTRLTAKEYLKPLAEADIDTLILGCTHYPLLAKVIGEIIGRNVKLINSASVVALAVRDRLEKEQLLKSSCRGNAPESRITASKIDFPGEYVRFYTSDSVDRFRELGGKFLGSEIEAVEKTDIEAY